MHKDKNLIKNKKRFIEWSNSICKMYNNDYCFEEPKKYPVVIAWIAGDDSGFGHYTDIETHYIYLDDFNQKKEVNVWNKAWKE